MPAFQNGQGSIGAEIKKRVHDALGEHAVGFLKTIQEQQNQRKQTPKPETDGRLGNGTAAETDAAPISTATVTAAAAATGAQPEGGVQPEGSMPDAGKESKEASPMVSTCLCRRGLRLWCAAADECIGCCQRGDGESAVVDTAP